MAPEEFTRIFFPLKDGLYRTAFKLLGTEEAAADAVQDTYMKLWSGRDRLDAVRNPYAWSQTLLRNLCIDRLRSAPEQSPAQLDPEMPAPNADTAPTERQERALTAVRRLSVQERELLHLRLVEGLGYEEIARRKGQSQAALRVAFHRLKNKLKKMI